MYIDTHAHLNYNDLQPELDAILERARTAGVEKIIVPATDLKSSLEIIELIQKYDMLYGAVGIHPTELKDFSEDHLQKIEELCTERKIVAIGEIGLDYHWEPFDAELQKHVLRVQFQIAKTHNLPVIIHNRKSSDDLMKIVREEYDNGKLKGQFHSFSGNIAMAHECIEKGFYISFTGNITYKPNEGTLHTYEIVKAAPITNILLETDTPYLAPMPHRGKKNEPAYVAFTALKIADLKSITVEELGQNTSQNAKVLYSIT